MKKNIGKVLQIFIIITMTLAIVETAYAAAAPLWQQGSFANAGQVSYAGSQGLVNSITQFHAQYLQNYRRVCNNNCCQVKSAAFRQVLVQGFQQDALLQVQPFNIDFIYEVLQNLVFCFAAPQPGQRSVGLYISEINAQSSRIWANPDRRTPELFARTVIHELGHAFGLGETLADLMAETFMGQEVSRRTQHNLAYNSTFDRILLETVGVARFWAAAYHSNEAFATLWNETFGDIITHAELEIVRGVSKATMANTSTANTFQTNTNVTAQQAGLTFFSYLQLLMNNERGTANTNSDILASAQTNLTNLVSIYVTFAVGNNISASNSVLDWVIESHHARIS